MNATAATTARPTQAAIAWATRDNLFCEIPCKDGPPLIVRYPLTAEGLRTALNILVASPETTHRTISPHPATRFSASPASDAEREGVRALLKGLKII